MTPKYVTVGGISLDWIINADGQYGIKSCGGNAMYSAASAHLWSDQVAVIGRVGKNYPAEYLQDFQAAGIDISGVRRVEEPHELMFAAQYNAEGGRQGFKPCEVFPRMGITTPEAVEEHDYAPARKNALAVLNWETLPEDTPPHYWDAKGFHLAGIYYRHQIAFAEELNRRGIPFTLDPGTTRSSQNSAEEELRHLLSLATVFMPSDDQLVWFIKETVPELAVDQLAAFGPKIIIIKQGRKGSLIYNSKTKTRRLVPIYPSRVKDPTGAGDSFCGGFLVGLLETGDAFEAALRATVSSSFAIEEFDARYLLRFSRQDAEARLNTLRRSIP
jgi:sugar/nucleoside kinase (ribokinase family)